MRFKNLKLLAFYVSFVPTLAFAQATIQVETQPVHSFTDKLHIDLHVIPSDDTDGQAADLWVYLQDSAGNKVYATPAGACLEGSADCSTGAFSTNETISETTIDIDDTLAPGNVGIPLSSDVAGKYSVHAIFTKPGTAPSDDGAVLSTQGSAYTSIVENKDDMTDRPNLVIFLADDLGYSDIEPFGGEVNTPTLNTMKESGTLLTNFHTHASCSPTRSITLSGVDNHRNGLGTMDSRLLPARLAKAINQYDRTEPVPADIEAISTAIDPETGKQNNPKFSQGKNIGKDGYEGHLNQKVVTIATVLRNAGYHTYMIGKWHLGEEIGFRPYYRGFEKTFALLEGAGSNFDHIGFTPNFPYTHYTQQGEVVELPSLEDEVVDGKIVKGVSTTRKEADSLVGYSDKYQVYNEFYSTRDYTDFMINSIDADYQANKAIGKRKPFFAYFAYQAPHAPLQAPIDLIEKYIPIYEQGWDEIRKQRFDQMISLGIIPKNLPYVLKKTEERNEAEEPKSYLPLRWDSVKAWGQLNANEQAFYAKKMAIYAAMIEYMDYNMQRFMDYLKNIGEYDNTIFLFFGDNGADDQGRDMGAQPPLDYLHWYPTVGITNCYPHHLEAKNTVITKKYVEDKNYADTPVGKNVVNKTVGNIKNEDCYEGMGLPKSMLTLPQGWAQVSTTPHFAAKATMAEGGLRASAIIMGPGIVRNRQSDAFMSALDVFPTFLDYAHVEHPVTKDIVAQDGLAPYRDVKMDKEGNLQLNLNPSFEYEVEKDEAGKYTNTDYYVRKIYPLDGRSFRSVFDGETDKVYGNKDAVGFELYGTINRALFMGDWKILKLSDKGWGGPDPEAQEWALFNLKDDPRELVDLTKFNLKAEPDPFPENFIKEIGQVDLKNDSLSNYIPTNSTPDLPNRMKIFAEMIQKYAEYAESVRYTPHLATQTNTRSKE